MKKAKLKRELETLRGHLEDLRGELESVIERVPPKRNPDGSYSAKVGVFRNVDYFKEINRPTPDLVTRDEMQKAIREATEPKDKQDGAQVRYCGRCPDGPGCKNPMVTFGDSYETGKTWKCDHCGFTGFDSPPSICPDCKGRFAVREGTYRRDYPIAPSVPGKPEAFPHELATFLHSRGCGTAYRGCAPDCPKDKHERELEAQPAGELGAAIHDAVICLQSGTPHCGEDIPCAVATRLEQAYEAHRQNDRQTPAYEALVQSYNEQMQRVAELESEIATSDELLKDRARLLDALPCEAHGSCVPHALEWIAGAKDNERVLLAALENKTREYEKLEEAFAARAAREAS